MEARRRRVMPETQTVEDALQAAADDQVDDADEAVDASVSASGVTDSKCKSDFSEQEESHPPSD